MHKGLSEAMPYVSLRMGRLELQPILIGFLPVLSGLDMESMCCRAGDPTAAATSSWVLFSTLIQVCQRTSIWQCQRHCRQPSGNYSYSRSTARRLQLQ
jgi:hypothetical protein